MRHMTLLLIRSWPSRTGRMWILSAPVILLLISSIQAFVPLCGPDQAQLSLYRPVAWRTSAAAPTTEHSAPKAVSPPPPPAAPAAAASRRPKREVNVHQLIESKGGYMCRLKVTNFNVETEHTIIVSRDLYQETCQLAGKPDLPIEDYFKAVIKFMIGRGMSLTNTEGMIDASVFPVNYFTVGQLAYFMDDTVSGMAEVIRDM